ncbi:MAG: ammonium transporter, partial [Hyphomonas sp.]
MGQLTGRWIRGALLAPLSLLAAGAAWAEEAAPLSLEERLAAVEAASAVPAYVDNSYLFLIGGLVVMFMAAGFCMLEAGLVRSKNAAMQSMKNVLLFSVAGLMFWLTGYNLAYPGEATLFSGILPTNIAIWEPAALEEANGGYASSSDWFFQMVFVATAASIVSGTVAERIRLIPFLLFTVVLTALIYPVVVSWEWGGGYLDTVWSFSDFAGSTLVHSVGGWAALTGAIIIGARKGKYSGGHVNPMPGSNIPLAALGTLILWLGWFGFNGASQLAAGTITDINSVSKIFANTNMAAVGGCLAAAVTTAVLYKGKIDATMVFNGVIGGLVSITAEPLAPSMGQSVLIGAVGGVLVVITVPLLDKLKIDDVVGAIPAHLVCGIWGTMIVPFTNSGASYAGQAVG